MSFKPPGSALGSTVEIAEIETLTDGHIIIGDGSGAPTTLAAFSSSTGTLKVANGGTGAATLTGLVKGNGTSAMAAATAGSDYAPGSIGLAGGQTIAGSTLTNENLTLRANAADLTTGQVNVSSSKEATNTTTASVALAGGLAVAKRVYALDMTVTNTITGTTSGNLVSGGALGTPSSGTGTNITGIPAANILPGTLATGTYVLAENASIGYDPAGSADGKFTGITVTATAGYSQAFGDLVYLDPTDSRWEAASVSAAAGADGDCRGILGMVAVAGTDGNACTILLQGIIRADANFPALTVNSPVYATTSGDITHTKPTTTDHVIRTVGFAITGDEIYFNPSSDYLTAV